MRTSKYLLFTMKNIPYDAEIASHRLMLRAGMIRKLASGIYTWLPTGLRVLKKVENIVRKAMHNAGAIEVLMPLVQPDYLWQRSGRWNQYGPELLRFTDRSQHSFVLAPTHEEVISNLISNELHSYKQLPIIFFQINIKFRDEMRPCFGVIRSREMLMKDAYSFHTSQESLQETYDTMYNTYNKIFTHIGLNFHVVQADSGSIGGTISHEFQALVRTDRNNSALLCNNSSYISNSTKLSDSLMLNKSSHVVMKKMKLIETPNITTINELAKQFNLPIDKIVKTILVKTNKSTKHHIIALLIRGDHNLNINKVEQLPQILRPLTLVNEEEIFMIMNANSNSLGPVNMPIPMVIDRAVAMMNNFVAGANINGKHYFGINWNRDVSIPEIADISNVSINNTSSSDNKSAVLFKNNIEIGHIFQLGTKYSQTMNAMIQGKDGYNRILTMGCYGIGITRVVAAVVEQNHDNRGIIWPDVIAPFQVVILPINMHKSSRIKKFAEQLYLQLQAQEIEVLIEDRQERPGVMFANMELIGIPHMVIIGNSYLYNDNIEYKYRRDMINKLIKANEIIHFLIKIIKHE